MAARAPRSPPPAPNAPALPGPVTDFTRKALRSLRSADPKLGALIAQVGPFRMEIRALHNPFQSLARSIVYQQLAGAAAARIHERVTSLFPRQKLTPEALLAMPMESLRGAGLSQNKALAMKDLAQKAVDGVVPSLRALARMRDEEIIERLTCVRGIGQWTVEMMLMFRLGRPDVLPVDDYGVRKGFARAIAGGVMPKPKELLAYGDRWRPWRTVASWYLWRAAELPDDVLPLPK